MKGMRFNLDMIWLKDNRVAEIVANVPFGKGEQELINPDVLADKILEINAGQAQAVNLKVGDKMELKP